MDVTVGDGDVDVVGDTVVVVVKDGETDGDDVSEADTVVDTDTDGVRLGVGSVPVTDGDRLYDGVTDGVGVRVGDRLGGAASASAIQPAAKRERR